MKVNYLLVLGILASFSMLAFALPPPTVGIDVVYPQGDMGVNQNRFFHVTANVSCLSNVCGDVDVYLDPAPPQCNDYIEIDWDANSIYEPYTTGDCSNDLEAGWYRLIGEYQAIPTQRSYIDHICNTHAPGFIDFAYPTEMYETTTGRICYHWGNTCMWQSDAIEVTACHGYYVYYLTPSPTCTLHPCTTDAIPPIIAEKTGLVSETPGDLPFYTNGSNPQTVNLGLGESGLVTFWVNATGAPWNYAFFAFANVSCSPGINDRTEDWNVEIFPEPAVSFVDLPHFIHSPNGPKNVPIEITTEYFMGPPESATLDSVWWNDGTDDYPYGGPATHTFAPGTYLLTAYANDTDGNVYSSEHELKVGNVECGDIIDSDVVLSYDLDCSGYDGYAVKIGADGVKFDCDEHAIYGPDDYSGIVLSHVDGVTVDGCTVTGFNWGIYMDDSHNNMILFNTLTDNYYGLSMTSSDFNRVYRNEFDSNDYGFYLNYADSNYISHNDVIDSDSSNFGSGSCPFLYLWNGSEYGYYTDLAGESLGGSWFETPLYEAGIYELGDFKAAGGEYRMKVREVIPESDFFDEAKLIVVDVPDGYGVLNQWHNTYSDDMAPPKEFMTIKDPKKPLSATDRYGNNALSEVSEEDGLPLRTHNGEPNSVIVDFGAIENPEYAKLIITGWSSYESNPGLSSQKNLLIETQNGEGEWVVAKRFGKFTGDSRTFVFDISGILSEGDTTMRISAPYSKTTINVIDQVLLDDSEPVPIEVTYIEPEYANLQWGGSAGYEYATTSHRHIVSNEQLPNNGEYLMYGNFTKYGDVLPLLGEADDMFAIMRHGDELELAFSDIAPKDGMDRHVFLLADVMYTIKYSVQGHVSDYIDPMPFHGMSKYPYGDGESYPDDDEHSSYRSEWNTRIYDKTMRYGGSLPNSFNNTVAYNNFFGAEDSTALYLENEDSTKIQYNTISGVYVGIEIYESVNSLIEKNDISSANGRALVIRHHSEDNIVRGNTLYSDASDECWWDPCTVVFIGGSEGNLVKDNTLSGVDSYGITLCNSDENEILGNGITTSNGVAAIYLKNDAEDNLFLRNTIRSDLWVYDTGEDNDFSDDYVGNRYYAEDGTPAWEMYDIIDTDGDGWADEGSDLPLDSCTASDFWDDFGEDFHPATTPEGVSGGDDDEEDDEALSVSLEASCDGNVVTVTSGSDEIPDARVYAKDSLDNDVALGKTDGDGEFEFDGCGMDVSVHVSKSGYLPADGEFELIGCEECNGTLPPEEPPVLPPEPECTSDEQCLASEECTDSKCVPVACECGEVQDHKCIEYGCCSDSDCAATQQCTDHFCVDKPAAPGCVSDSDCAQGMECKGGECVEKPAPPAEDLIKSDATGAIGEAQGAIDSSKGEGKDTSGAEAKLAEAKAAFEDGNYEQAKSLAMQAKTLAMNAAAAPPESEGPEQPAPQPQGGSDAGLIALLLLGVLVLGGAAWFAIRKKK